MDEEIKKRILSALGLKRTAEEEGEDYDIECPRCETESPYVGCDEENQAIHHCPKCDIYFKVLLDGTIVVAEAEGTHISIDEVS